MSSGRFLGSALAAREGSYFLQQSKSAVGNLISRKRISPTDCKPSNLQPDASDVLPEILRHSLPLSPPPNSPPPSSSLSKWAISSTASSSPRSFNNPISAYISLPQVTFGPKRWELPSMPNSVTASTANELRADRYDRQMSPEKMKAAAAGLTQVGKAFAVATVLVFGGATCAFITLTSMLQIQSSDDIRVKIKDILQKKVEPFKNQLLPLQEWVKATSRRWHIEQEGIKDNLMVKELSKRFGGKSLN